MLAGRLVVLAAGRRGATRAILRPVRINIDHQSISKKPLWTGSWLHARQEAAPANTEQASSHASNHDSYSQKRKRSRDPQAGLTTPAPAGSEETKSQSPFYFETGYSGWAKRSSRPFPPPFFSPPSGSFSDPLSTHSRPKDHDGHMLRGVTNGDDAMLSSETLIGTNDGVGQWAQREKGHAPLWSRLIIHFWALEAEKDVYGGEGDPDPVQYLEAAYERTKEALSEPNEWHGTTTASVAMLHYSKGNGEHPVLYVTQLGDCKILVVRALPEKKDDALADVLFSTKDQYHYFDCPRQLGTNSPDTPRDNAVLDKVDIQENDIVLALSDGVTDNLWEEEVADYAVGALNKWKDEHPEWSKEDHAKTDRLRQAMKFVAQEIVLSARKIAEDPFAASPFMEKAVEEGLAIEGGKIDDISVVAAMCKRRKKG